MHNIQVDKKSNELSQYFYAIIDWISFSLEVQLCMQCKIKYNGHKNAMQT